MADAESGLYRASRREVRSGLARLGHRKIAAMLGADGHQVFTSTVQRALRRRGLLLATGFRADRRSWARLRKRVFRDPPRQQNRVWQMDFSEFETARGGIWRICVVIDYLDDLGADRGVMDVVDADDDVIGEAPTPIAVVTDNGHAFVA
jgi:putative transposase